MKSLIKIQIISILFVFMAMKLEAQNKIEIDPNYGEYKTISSKALGKEVPVLIFLPSDYKTSSKQYSVVYFLHGYNSEEISEKGLRKMYNPQTKIQEAANMYNVIIACPMQGNCFYLDAPLKPEQKNATFTGTELTTWMDKNYRTIDKREGRIIAGFSMGGYGAISQICRFPDVFSAALSRGGALNLAFAIEELYWDEVGLDLESILGDYWSKDKKNYFQNNCLNLINHIRERKDVGIVIEVGKEDFLYSTNLKFHKRLEELDMKHVYAEFPEGHLLDSNTFMSLLSHLQYFVKTTK